MVFIRSKSWINVIMLLSQHATSSIGNTQLVLPIANTTPSTQTVCHVGKKKVSMHRTLTARTSRKFVSNIQNWYTLSNTLDILQHCCMEVIQGRNTHKIDNAVERHVNGGDVVCDSSQLCVESQRQQGGNHLVPTHPATAPRPLVTSERRAEPLCCSAMNVSRDEMGMNQPWT